MTDVPKFCVACKWHFPGTPSDCRAPENKRVNMVTGETVSGPCADIQRQMEVTGCTKEGKWWKPKTQQGAA